MLLRQKEKVPYRGWWQCIVYCAPTSDRCIVLVSIRPVSLTRQRTAEHRCLRDAPWGNLYVRPTAPGTLLKVMAWYSSHRHCQKTAMHCLYDSICNWMWELLLCRSNNARGISCLVAVKKNRCAKFRSKTKRETYEAKHSSCGLKPDI